MKMKFRRSAGIGGFHADYLNDKTAIQRRKKLGLTRTIFSALSLLFGAGMCYVAMHYIPAFVHPKKILKFATNNSLASQTYDFDRHSEAYGIFGSFVDLFHLDRAYMRSGQSINIKYDLPEGSYAKLTIVQCKTKWVLEIFDCSMVSEFNTRTKRFRGVESFKLDQDGFYHFSNIVKDVPDGEPYRIVWERSI